MSHRDINPHIPQYISSAPWYFGSGVPTLKHQRPQEEKQKSFAHLNEYYVRGQKIQKANKYRPGACENCGAMTHKKKDCLDRPRKVGAKFSNESIAPDEVLPPSLNLDYDGKRDRWTGFDPAMYKDVLEEHSKVEEAKQLLKEEKLKNDIVEDDEAERRSDKIDSDSDSEEDE